MNCAPLVAYLGRSPLRAAAVRLTVLLIAAVTMSGCAQRGAPSFVFFGAFFPAWMLVAGMGILAAMGTRFLLLATGLGEAIPLQLLVCVSVGLTIAILTWLLWFGA